MDLQREGAAAGMTMAVRVPALRVFFGHQSVGADLVEGLRQLNVPAAWILESRVSVGNTGACLLHARLGRNRDPLGNLADFSNLLQNGLGQSIDLVLMKFRYVALESKAEVLPLFAEYRQCMGERPAALPNLAVGHVTVPLGFCPMGMLGTLQRLLLGADLEVACNSAGEEFNALPCNEYAEKGPLLDLARIESRCHDDKVISVRWQGAWVQELAPQLTRDGGHASDRGCRMVAMEFMRFVRRAAERLGREAP